MTAATLVDYAMGCLLELCLILQGRMKSKGQNACRLRVSPIRGIWEWAQPHGCQDRPEGLPGG